MSKLLPFVQVRTAFTGTFNQNATGWDGYSDRVVFPVGAVAGINVRVTFRAATTGANFHTNNVSIGLLAAGGSGVDTTATPTEILFSAGHGFNIAAGATIVSDWTVFSLPAGAQAVIIIDHATPSDARQGTSSTGMFRGYKAASASYNSATVTGQTTVADLLDAVDTIEIR